MVNRPHMTTTDATEPANRKKMSLAKPPEFDTCNFYVEAISPAFEPKRVLLRRLFLIDDDRTKYVSVGFYPTRDYQPFVEFGAV